MTPEWTTLLPPDTEFHVAYLGPRGWSGKQVFNLIIPVCELAFVSPDDGPPPATLPTISRPAPGDRDVKGWTLVACRLAAENRVAVSFICDTAAQAEIAVRRARRWLPATYVRIPLERVIAGRAAEVTLS